MMEASCHESNSFVTLTYSDGAIVTSAAGVSTLVAKHATDWLKRFRKKVEPLRVRYYLVGEYGDATQRPHYHVAMFGYPACRWGNTQHRERCCDVCDTIRSTWGLGHIVSGDLNLASAAYIAGYISKKITSRSGASDREPVFARMSLRPGIGYGALWDVASAVMESRYVEQSGDVPAGIRYGANTILPMGRYLRRGLRVLVGNEAAAPESTIEAAKADMRPLYEAAWAPNGFVKGPTFKELYLAVTKPQADQVIHRAKMRRKHEAL